MIAVCWSLVLLGLVAASLAVAHLPPTATIAGLFADRWFDLGLAAMVLAAVAHQLLLRRRAHQGAIQHQGSAAISDALAEIRQSVQRLVDQPPALPALVAELDALLGNQVFAIAEARPALIAALGQAGYAAFMGHFATAERFIARAWSAAVDDCPEEAFDSLRKALPFLDHAILERERLR